MKATDIERVPFAAFDDALVAERHELAKKAYKKLGYTRLSQETNPAANLLATLRKLEIEPLNALAVERYKAGKERTFMRRSTIELAFAWLFGTFVALAPVLSLAIYMHVHNFSEVPDFSFGHDYSMPPLWMAMMLLPLGAWAILSIVTLCRATWGDEALRTPRMLRRWKRYSLKGYEGSVPEHVLERALQINAECLTADFFIEQLVTEVDAIDAKKLSDEREARIVRLRDPFLIVATKDESYYVDVWDEKEYERTI